MKKVAACYDKITQVAAVHPIVNHFCKCNTEEK